MKYKMLLFLSLALLLFSPVLAEEGEDKTFAWIRNYLKTNEDY